MVSQSLNVTSKLCCDLVFLRDLTRSTVNKQFRCGQLSSRIDQNISTIEVCWPWKFRPCMLYHALSHLCPLSCLVSCPLSSDLALPCTVLHLGTWHVGRHHRRSHRWRTSTWPCWTSWSSRSVLDGKAIWAFPHLPLLLDSGFKSWSSGKPHDISDISLHISLLFNSLASFWRLLHWLHRTKQALMFLLSVYTCFVSKKHMIDLTRFCQIKKNQR